MQNSKIKTREQAIEIAQRLRRGGEIIVTTNGSFDLIHPAHIRLFERSRNQGDYLFVLLNSDSSIKRNKGEKRPIVQQADRAYVLSSLESVDYVTIFDEDKPLSILEQLKPHIHVKGGTYIPERVREEEDLLNSWGGKFIALEEEPGYSSSNIIQRILDAYNGK